VCFTRGKAPLRRYREAISWNGNCLTGAMRTIHSKIKKATSTPVGKIIAIGLLVLVLAAIAGGVIYWKIYRKQIVRNELENAISKKSGGLYALRYDSLKMDEAAGNLAVTNLSLQYDSTVYLGLEKNNDQPPTLLKISIPKLFVTGVKTPRALLGNEIVGKKLHIVDPVIDIFYTNAGQDSSRNIPTSEVYRQILGGLNNIQIDSVEITGAKITTANLKTGNKNVSLDSTSLLLVDVAINEKTGHQPGQLMFAQQVFLHCKKLSWENKRYDYSMDSFALNSIDSSIHLRRFSIDPKLKEDAFVRSLPTQDDRFDFSFTNIRVRNIDMRRLFEESVVADTIHVSNATFRIYRDLAIPRDRKNRVGSYPHQLLAKVPISLQVKKLVLAGAFVEYKERSNITRQAGKVQFNQVYATISNLTNDADAIKANNVMTADISTRFLNQVPLNVVWRFYLNNPRGRFDLKGNLGSLAAPAVNPLTVPMGPAKLEEGRINSLSFDFEGDNYKNSGTVKMLYKDLKLAILEKEKGSNKLDKKGLASFVANIVVKNENPKGNDEPRVIQVDMERDTNRSIFSLVWKSLFKGIKETVGIKK
jgi:hypothetical protein